MGGVTMGIVLCSLLLVLFLGFASGYYDDNACYYCSDTGANPDCQDYKKLRKANMKQDDKDQILIRNCSASQPYCMIEKVVKQGAVYSYIRDCTDKDHFSVAKEGRLQVLVADNVTVCTFDTTTMAQFCISVCTGKLCNGPQIAAGNTPQALWVLLMSAGVLILQYV